MIYVTLHWPLLLEQGVIHQSKPLKAFSYLYKPRIYETFLFWISYAAVQKCSMQKIYRKAPMSKCDFNKVAKQLYQKCTSAWVFYCKFVNFCIFSEHFLLRTPLNGCFWNLKIFLVVYVMAQFSAFHQLVPINLKQI